MMSLAIDSREMGVMGFRDQEIKKDEIMAARGFPGFLETRFHGKHVWVREEKGGERLAGFHVGSENDDFSSGSSSIGVCSNSTVDDADNEEGEVQSRFRSPLDRLDSLEDSLPIKRGLSSYFSGKAKSFGCLSDAVSVEDLSKTESPLNKRRRILLACKNGARIQGELRSNLSAFRQKSLLEEKIVEEEEWSKGAGEEEDGERSEVCVSPLPQSRKLRSFISPRSYSLSNLHREG